LADLEALRTGLGIDSMAVIGWSGLGMEMFVYAMRHPERVSGLVQVAPVAARDEPHNATAYATRAERIDTAAQRVLRERRAQGEFTADSATYCRELGTLTSPANFADPAFAAAVPDPCRFPNEYPDSLGQLFTSLLGSFAGYDWREAARTLPIRRLVIHGRQDAFPLEGSREWVPAGSSARLLVIDSAGHFPFVERPDVFFPAVDAFLRGGWPADATAPAVGSSE
jgi:proline iminopeptidase